MLDRRMLDRLTKLEEQVQKLVDSSSQQAKLDQNIELLLATFQALQGAWKVLEFIGKLAKPIAFIGVLIGITGAFLSKYKS